MQEIGFEFYCKELFMVKYKSKYSCESTIYFDLDPEIIEKRLQIHILLQQNRYYFTVLDGENEIILAN